MSTYLDTPKVRKYFQMVDSLESAWLRSSTVHAARIAKVEGLSMDTTFDFFKSRFEKIVVSSEGDGRGFHLHLMLVGPATKKEILAMITELYPTAKGNKCKYVKLAENVNQLLKYTLKEGSYRYSGFTEEFIKDMFKLSKPKTDLKLHIIELEDKLLTGKITFSQFGIQHIHLKVTHGQNLYDSHIIAYFKRMAIACGEREEEEYAHSLIDSAMGLRT